MSPSHKKVASKNSKKCPLHTKFKLSSNWILFSYEFETAFTCLQVKKKWPKSSKNCPQLNSSSNWTLFSYELETALSQKSGPKMAKNCPKNCPGELKNQKIRH